jgi:hypothetical protein
VQSLLDGLSRLRLEPLRGGIRRIEKLLPQADVLSRSEALLSVASRHLPGAPRLVRAIYFDKSPDNNWFVTWHQDRTVAVSERFEKAGWGPWSLKSGVWHVQPPLEVLQEMVTLRVHLDAANRDNGCLKVIPGSHTLGMLASDRVQEHVHQDQVVYCEAGAGGVVVMRPHILHSSEKAVSRLARRILHFEYSSYHLPEGIGWSP